MKKKVVYLDSKTGKEVKYGDHVCFSYHTKTQDGLSFKADTTIPIINETIPYLIEKGIIIQKEIEVKETEVKEECSTSDKNLNSLIDNLSLLTDKLTKLTDALIKQKLSTNKNHD